MDIMSKLFGRSSIGIDLGTAKMRVWVAGEGLVPADRRLAPRQRDAAGV